MLNYNAQGLIPAIIQDDETDAVLMLGYMNPETLQMTQRTGQVVFWSRSRQGDLAQGRDERRLPGGAVDQGRLREQLAARAREDAGQGACATPARSRASSRTSRNSRPAPA